MLTPQTILQQLPTKIYADGADRAGMIRLNEDPLIQGLTTNPTLMKKAGISNYESFAQDVLQVIKTKPISFEVFSDQFDEMRRQALKIATKPTTGPKSRATPRPSLQKNSKTLEQKRKAPDNTPD